ncbi:MULTISPECIES: hypothetical protein [Acinetobacter]|uniref:hypothetical protein n=1 Tax=Acinetobacter TaxID=469 RepID=UPI001444508E|nr:MULTISPECIES: hypothetical protein [Acinetobacter]
MNSAGRPKKSAVNLLQTIFWYEYVNLNICASNLERGERLTEEAQHIFKTHANKIADFFEQNESGIWYKYRDGIKTPSKSTLEYIDLKVPNASVYFYHPLWKFLDTIPSSRDLEKLYANLELETRKAIEKGLVLNPQYQHPNYDLDEMEFTKYANILDFYAYILYCYYKAKFILDLKLMQNTIDFFKKNIPILFQLQGELSIFFFDLYTKHLIMPKHSTSILWEQHSFVLTEEINAIRQEKRYRQLNQLIQNFVLC